MVRRERCEKTAAMNAAARWEEGRCVALNSVVSNCVAFRVFGDTIRK
ncbi:hypothetical protein PLANPX_6070 [Lacipirellula parvula]|uniref:Uncharacterized protein n=1 Tax=Lacipirellula parvula TaxID=2650471 RepID=A0A5K7XIY7_9BACT|nr:hypothetical protein PLANPX_6070 [Lacipirellula parvula]